MKETNLTQDAGVEMGGGPIATAIGHPAATPAERAAAAKARVMEVFALGVNPTYEHFITKREDGVVCACAIGALAFSLGSELMARKGDLTNRISSEARAAFTNQICQATGDLKMGEVTALEEGFMGYPHGYNSSYFQHRSETGAFYDAGKQIRKEAFTRV